AGHVEIVRRLLALGADPLKRPDPPTTEVRTCLNAAAFAKKLEIVQMLLACEGQVEAINVTSGPNVTTALLAGLPNNDIFTLLLDSGADITVSNSSGYNALHFLADLPDEPTLEIAKKLLELKPELGNGA